MGAEYLGRLQSGDELVRFSCALETCAEGEKPAAWIHILPHGSIVEARDGRKFAVEDANEVVRCSELPMLVDWEHASESGDTRAAGWVEQLKVEPASAGDKAGVWGRVNWTPQGVEHVKTQHYRFLSPVVVGKRASLSDGGLFHVNHIRSVALTNRPALRMHGIESFREQLSQRLGPIDESGTGTEDDPMTDKLRKALCSAFGLPADADEDAIANAAKPVIEQARKSSSAGDSTAALSQMTHELSEERKQKAALETELASFRKQTFSREVEVFFDKGSREGRITPQQRKKWLAFCQKNPANFKTFSEVIYPQLEPIASRAPKSSKASAESFKSKSPNGVDREALRKLGYSEAIILEAERDVFAKKVKTAGRDEAPDDEDEDDDGKPGTGDADEIEDDLDADGESDEDDDEDDAADKPAASDADARDGGAQ